MYTGSLKDLVRVLSAALSLPTAPHPLPEDVMTTIQAYLNKHSEMDEHDSQRLHDELLNLHLTKVAGYRDKHAAFLSILRALKPAINGVDRLLSWWDLLVRPTLDSLGQAKVVVADARAIALNVLVYDEEEDKTGEKARASAVFTEKLFELFLEKTKLLSTLEGNVGFFAEEERQRFVVANVEAVLLAYGKRKPKAFLETIDTYIVQKESRLQILGLLCSFVRLQGPHLYQVLETPLLGHLLQCLQTDTSTTVISIALTILIMFMPHICNSLSNYLSQLFVIYTRVICWDKYGLARLEETKSPTLGGKETHMRADSPDSSKGDAPWQKLDSSFETAASTTPDISDFFTFLYGLYPMNFVTFIREPYKFLERTNYKELEDLDFDEETIRMRSEKYRQRHTLHPNFFTLTAETEITDQARWMKMEAADITALCIGLVNSNIQLPPNGEARHVYQARPIIPDALLPTEDIPTQSLLSIEDDDLEEFSSSSKYGFKENGQAPNQRFPDAIAYHARRSPLNQSHSNSPSVKAGDFRVPDSPTLPPQTGKTASDEPRVQDMLHLQQSLKTSSIGRGNESTTSLPIGAGYGSVTASPRLEAYVHFLNRENIPRSPAIRPAASDAQAAVAYLQREVMLLKNDLNFERYLKQQHLSHIGHLQRQHIKESAAEAETQQLIYTNKALKAKLEESKKALARVKAEALTSKNQSKKWEADLNAKIRALREEQKVWKAEEESVKKALETAQKDVEHLRRLVSESEAKELLTRQHLKAVEGNLKELDELRVANEQLRNQLQEFDARQDEYEMRKHSEESAIAQADRLKLRLQALLQEKEQMKRAYEQKIQEYQDKLSAAEASANYLPGPGPAMQAMIDSALASANQRLAAVKRTHQKLLDKYSELEIKHLELQASDEIGNLHRRHQMGHTRLEHPGSNGASPTDGQHRSPQFYQSGNRPSYASEGASPTTPSETSRGTGSSLQFGNSFQQSVMSSLHHSPVSPPSHSPCPTILPSQYMNYHRYAATPSRTPPPITPLPPTPNDCEQPEVYVKRPELRNMPSFSEGLSMGGSSDNQSIMTTTSSQDSQGKKKKEKVKASSEMRVRGRGGVQNIGKKDKEKEVPKEKEKAEKKEKKYKFPTGSGLAGIRGFV